MLYINLKLGGVTLVLDRHGSIPLYEQIKNIIEQQIKNGELKEGEKIPSERELCEIYDVSRITVRQAIALAENEGLLYRSQGMGTFVAKPKIKQELTHVNTFETSLAQHGFVASTKIRKVEIIPNSIYFNKLLEIPISDKIINLQLIGYGDEEPIVYYSSYFAFDLGQKMHQAAYDASQKNKPFSTLDLYTHQSDVTPTQIQQTYEATISDEAMSDILKVPQRSPIFSVTSIVYAKNRPIEYREAHYRGDKYKFSITRQLDLPNTESTQP